MTANKGCSYPDSDNIKGESPNHAKDLVCGDSCEVFVVQFTPPTDLM